MSAPHRPNPQRDGGLAFPRPASIDPAFDARCASQTGMSMRDFYAAHALAGLVADLDVEELRRPGSFITRKVVGAAFAVADAMIEKRAEGI